LVFGTKCAVENVYVIGAILSAGLLELCRETFASCKQRDGGSRKHSSRAHEEGAPSGKKQRVISKF
jgi:hypothetical protein